MNHWLLDSLSDERASALNLANQIQVGMELSNDFPSEGTDSIFNVANALELAALDLIQESFQEDDDKLKTMRECASDAFRLFSVLPPLAAPLENARLLLRMSALAVLGDRGSDAARMLRLKGWGELPLETGDWGERTWATVLDAWLRLIRKNGWEDRDAVLDRVARLRTSQAEFEKHYLDSASGTHAKATALELIGLYHIAKAAEILALFITDGVAEGSHQVAQKLETHFDRAISACGHARLLDLEPLVRLLAAAAAQMVENSIWTVTRAVNSRVTQFVRTLVERGRGNKVIFDVLPPQRRALAEKGLLGSSRRAVVVSLPTSSGKTLIAQFRILQALNQFEHEEGWVAYLVPTRTLVNQITRRIRRDFLPLGLVVERVSPALEVDTVEMSLLNESKQGHKFRVLVSTPEKFDLLIRQGWEEKIGRPLTLVVVDEAHNIQDEGRGLKLELLLSTINKECERAQFLLLTPFIQNAREIARWLGGQNSEDVSLALDWQPNDRIVGIVHPEKGDPLTARSYDYELHFESVHTTRKTIAIENALRFPKVPEVADTFAKASNPSDIAAMAAQHLKKRGPVILMHQRPDWAWSLADKLKFEANRASSSTSEIKLVQDYLRLEFGDEFPLIELLNYGIGVHHSGLPDEVRNLMEWLFENDKLNFLVATTTIAQGVNFPVSGVVMASHQYPYGNDMPPEDFWNIAGRAGRIDQGQLGVVALAAQDNEKADQLREFINRQTGDLNSALIQLAKSAGEDLNDLGRLVYKTPEWSAFLQYLAHTYRQMGEPDSYFDEIEQVLRGTLGFAKLRLQDSSIAQRLLDGIETYVSNLVKPGQPLKLVDSTGFSLESIKTVLTHKGNINEHSWKKETLFKANNDTLQQMMGVLLRVPELRKNLEAVTGGMNYDGSKLALILKDWVNGESIPKIANEHFRDEEKDDQVSALTKCGQNLFGRLSQATSWGLGALLAITASGLPEDEFENLRNLPSKVLYGVHTDEAVTMRLLGVPRTAAVPLAENTRSQTSASLPEIRKHLEEMTPKAWNEALGDAGTIYRNVWRVLEGLNP